MDNEWCLDMQKYLFNTLDVISSHGSMKVDPYSVAWTWQRAARPPSVSAVRLASRRTNLVRRTGLRQPTGSGRTDHRVSDAVVM